MTLEIRTITSDEIEQAEAIAAAAFNDRDRHNLTPAVERAKRFYQPDWYLAAFEDGEMTSMMRMLPFAMRINGRAVPFGAVSPVANSPLHRRKGHTGAMLRESLRVMRERGQAVSGLYTPHPAFYRRYGWEVASEGRTYTFKPKDLRLQVQPRVRGRLRSLKAEDWQALDGVYRTYSARRNGPLHRGEVWWRNAVLRETDQPPPDVVAWEGESGEAEGYVVYGQPREGREEAGKVVVHELVATGADAYLNLLAFLGNHDVHEEVSLRASPEEPFLNLMADPDRLQARFGYAVLLRVCDFEAAMNARPPAEGAEDVDVTVEVSDPVAPWNEGVWRTGIAAGRTFAERASGEAELRLAAGVLGPLFNGYLTPSTAGASGLAWLRDAGTARRADALFAVEHRPFFPDFF